MVFSKPESRQRAKQIRELAKTGSYTPEELAEQFHLKPRTVKDILWGNKNIYGVDTEKIFISKIRINKRIALSHLFRKLGLSVAMIAGQLGVSTGCVSVYLRRKDFTGNPSLMIEIRNTVEDEEAQRIESGIYKLKSHNEETAMVNNGKTVHFVKFSSLLLNIRVIGVNNENNK